MAFPEYRIRVIELCKGTDRFRKPPARLVPQEAPWRLSLGLHRHQMQSVDLGPWMIWENLRNRQLCAKSPPLRLLITIFAQKAVRSESSRPVHEDGSPIVVPEMEAKMPRESVPMDDEKPTDETIKVDIQGSQHVTHGPKFRMLSKEQQNWISKIHHNLGHPSVLKLQNMLKAQGYNPEIIQGVADYRCCTCHETYSPRIA